MGSTGIVPPLSYADHVLHVDRIIKAGLAAVDPGPAVSRHISLSGSRLRIGQETFDLDCGRLAVIGAGKAVKAMAQATVDVFAGRIDNGILIAKAGEGSNDPGPLPFDQAGRIQIRLAAHPVSDHRSVEATKEVIRLLDTLGDRDLVLVLLSGGASSLMTSPLVSLDVWQKLTDALLNAGCNIHELNSVRRRLDDIKGGGLVRRISPARGAVLVLSDVIGNPLADIGSGPAVANPDSPDKARRILERYHIEQVLGPAAWRSVLEALERSSPGEASPVPVVTHTIIGDVRQAARAAVAEATLLGFSARLSDEYIEGEAREAGRYVAGLARNLPPGSCLVLGGETTVTVQGDGLGGRNLELALAAAMALAEFPLVTVAAFATDGEDGPSGASGAIITGETVPRAFSAGLDPRDYLERNDSLRFFDQVGGLLRMGPTGTNVNDLAVILKYRSNDDR